MPIAEIISFRQCLRTAATRVGRRSDDSAWWLETARSQSASGTSTRREERSTTRSSSSEFGRWSFLSPWTDVCELSRSPGAGEVRSAAALRRVAADASGEHHPTPEPGAMKRSETSSATLRGRAGVVREPYRRRAVPGWKHDRRLSAEDPPSRADECRRAGAPENAPRRGALGTDRRRNAAPSQTWHVPTKPGLIRISRARRR